MKTALIGYSGFVGSTLDRTLNPDARFRSNNINDIRGQNFGHIICAGVQAVKWWANLHPDEDRARIHSLLDALRDAKAGMFTLISTIDVYPSPREVDEDTPIGLDGHHPYGLHRLEVEETIQALFSNVTILRLPGLFGPGLKKNVIFDLMSDNQLDKVHPEGSFQYYDTRRLAGDINRAWERDIPVLNVSSEPVATGEIRDLYFPGKALGGEPPPPPAYDMRSRYDAAWNGSGGYLYSKETVLRDLEGFLRDISS
ncbi:MAG: NAD(P)-dependent oxidoreductase [Akkermansiaceae bacterium]|nr:NAD(P)-dependent oxidoreductase [Akkermansiaceae bacterium]